MNNHMEQDGYVAEINYSGTDEVFYGVLKNIGKDSVSFEGKSVEELKKAFKVAVDDYLDFCRRHEKKEV